VCRRINFVLIVLISSFLTAAPIKDMTKQDKMSDKKLIELARWLVIRKCSDWTRFSFKMKMT
jgi:hypothetical protein